MQQYCNAALQAQTMLDLSNVSTVELSVCWLDEDNMQALNLQYRGRNSPTNVLSFESDMPALALGEGSQMLALGDIIVCPTVIDREARQQHKALQEHWAHMLVHGTLHLCGYDHQNTRQASDMESVEVNVLARSGMADPYRVSTAP